MDTESIKIGIAGCGKVARLHAGAIQSIEQATLVAAWSRSPQSAAAFSDEFSITAYASVSEMVAQQKIDLLIVCTPHPFHQEPALEAAQAGVHVLVEKPLASTLEHCEQIIEACRKNQVKLGVVSQRRWYEPCARVHRAITEGRIGEPILATATLLGWRDPSYYAADDWRGTWAMEGGGVLVNQAPHILDLLLWYMGEVVEVFGTWSNFNHPSIEVEDTAISLLRFKNGALGNLVLSNSQNPGLYGNVHVHGKNGHTLGVQSEGGSMFIAGSTSIQEPPFNDLWTLGEDKDNSLDKWKARDAEAFQKFDSTLHYLGLQLSDFVQAIKEDRQPVVTGESGRKVVELFTAIYRSNRDRCPVRLPLAPEPDNSDLDGRLKTASKRNV